MSESEKAIRKDERARVLGEIQERVREFAETHLLDAIACETLASFRHPDLLTGYLGCFVDDLCAALATLTPSEGSGAPLPEGEKCEGDDSAFWVGLALSLVRKLVERDGSQVLWLHDKHGEAFGLLLVEPQPKGAPRPLLDAAEKGMIDDAAWNPYDHSHIDPTDYADDPGTGKKPLPEAPRCGGSGRILQQGKAWETWGGSLGEGGFPTKWVDCPGCPDCAPEPSRCGGEATNPAFFGSNSEDEFAVEDGFCQGRTTRGE